MADEHRPERAGALDARAADLPAEHGFRFFAWQPFARRIGHG